MDLTDIWLDADKFGEAWFRYGEEALKEQYRDGTNEARAKVAQNILVGDLYRDLADGTFIAIGFQTAPNVSGVPLVVPRHLFGEGPPPDWDSGKIAASGLVFDRVRVLPRQVFQRLTADLIATPAPSPTPEPRVDRPEQQAAVQNRKPGRKNTYALCSAVFDSWAEMEPKLLELSAEQLEERFKQDYDTIHGEVANFTPAPKVRTLREKLGEYRSANTGRNRQE